MNRLRDRSPTGIWLLLALLVSFCGVSLPGTAQIATVVGPNGLDLQQNALLTEITNNGSSAPATNKLVVLTGSPATATKASVSTTTGIVGICLVNCTTSGNAVIAIGGVATCNFDNTTVGGDYVQASTTPGDDGECDDVGSSYPTNAKQVLGQVLSAGTGNQTMMLYPGGIRSGLLPGGGANTLQYKSTSTAFGGVSGFISDGINITAESGGALDMGTNQAQFKNYPCAPQFSTTDTVIASTVGTTETVFSTNCLIPASAITNHKILRVWWTTDSTTAASSPSLTIKVKLCTASGCGTGTVKDVFVSRAIVSSNLSGSSSGSWVLIQGTGAAGASVPVECSGTAMLFSTGNTSGSTNPTQVSGVPTSSGLYLSLSATWSANTAGNSVTLTQLFPEWIN